MGENIKSYDPSNGEILGELVKATITGIEETVRKAIQLPNCGEISHRMRRNSCLSHPNPSRIDTVR